MATRAISRGSPPGALPARGMPLLYLAGEDRVRRTGGAGPDASAPWWSIAPPRPSVFRPRRARRWSRARIDGVLHFSRRSVESYLDCGRDIVGPALKPVHYCLSARAAEPLRLAGAARIEVAARPDEASLLALVTPKSCQSPVRIV